VVPCNQVLRICLTQVHVHSPSTFKLISKRRRNYKIKKS
jgi:hypothetical protein